MEMESMGDPPVQKAKSYSPYILLIGVFVIGYGYAEKFSNYYGEQISSIDLPLTEPPYYTGGGKAKSTYHIIDIHQCHFKIIGNAYTVLIKSPGSLARLLKTEKGDTLKGFIYTADDIYIERQKQDLNLVGLKFKDDWIINPQQVHAETIRNHKNWLWAGYIICGIAILRIIYKVIKNAPSSIKKEAETN